MKEPSPSKPRYASKEERELFEAARLQFINEGKLDALKAFLRRGKSVSARVAEEIAGLMSDRDKITFFVSGEGDLHFALVVKAEKSSRGRPHLSDSQERLWEAARVVYDRIEAGEPREQTLRAVCKDYGLNLNELRAALRVVEEAHGELPRWPSKKKAPERA